MHLALEEQMDITLPGKTNATVELHGPAAGKYRHLTGTGFSHMGQFLCVGKVQALRV